MDELKIIEDRLYSRKEVAWLLKVSVYTVDNYVKDGKIEKVCGMHFIRITGKELLRFVNNK